MQVIMPNGDVNYTRNDSLKLDSLGQMVTSNGNPIQPTITIPSDAISITIGTDGVVSVLQPGSPVASQIGQIETVSFVNSSGLEPVGQNLFRESVASGTPTVGTPGTNELGAPSYLMKYLGLLSPNIHSHTERIG